MTNDSNNDDKNYEKVNTNDCNTENNTSVANADQWSSRISTIQCSRALSGGQKGFDVIISNYHDGSRRKRTCLCEHQT